MHIEKFSNEIYESSAVRKAVLLSRLGSLLQHWLVDENTKRDNGETLLKLGRPLPSHFQLENVSLNSSFGKFLLFFFFFFLFNMHYVILFLHRTTILGKENPTLFESLQVTRACSKSL